MRVAMVSGPAKRRLASMPVSASGDRLARSSNARRSLVVPVERIGRDGDEAERERRVGGSNASPARAAAPPPALPRRRSGWCSRVSPFAIGKSPKLAGESAMRGAALSPAPSASM